jgi:hypothetical protein
MKNTFVILLAIISFSCKNNEKKEVKLDEANEIITETPALKVIINATVLVDDVFEVYFYQQGDEKFKSNDFINASIVGSPNPQEIVFTLPENVYPERLRLDFGKNRKQKEIELYSVQLFYGWKAYTFSKEELRNDLKPSKFIDYNMETMTIRTKEVDNRYDPYFYTMKVTNIVNYLMED